MTKVPKPEDRKIEELRRALHNLRSANEMWEKRQYEQSENIASILRLLLYEGSSKSVFKQHDLKRVHFYTNPVYMINPSATNRSRKLAHGVTEASWNPAGQKSARVCWQPVYPQTEEALANPFNIDYRTKWNGLPFDEWWGEEVLHGETYSYTRCSLVITLANRLGGVHSDPKIDQHELDLLNNRFGYGYTDITLDIGGEKYSSVNKVYEAAIRQISYELERTIAHHFPDLLPPMEVVPPIPDSWITDTNGIGIRANRSPEEELQIYDQNVCADGEWSGIAEWIRREIYWNRHRSNLRKFGL